MKIGVISDTHIPNSAKKLPGKVCDFFKDCDLIIHAGDIVEKEGIEELEALAETKAVRGNMDSVELKEALPKKLVLKVAGKKIGVVHGSGPAFKVLQMAKNAFDEKLDVIIFGHTHNVVNETVDGTLYFNPGSPTDNVFAKYRSFGIIEIDGDDLKAKIIRIDD